VKDLKAFAEIDRLISECCAFELTKRDGLARNSNFRSSDTLVKW